jgi:hypothetical protein
MMGGGRRGAGYVAANAREVAASTHLQGAVITSLRDRQRKIPEGIECDGGALARQTHDFAPELPAENVREDTVIPLLVVVPPPRCPRLVRIVLEVFDFLVRRHHPNAIQIVVEPRQQKPQELLAVVLSVVRELRHKLCHALVQGRGPFHRVVGTAAHPQ